MAEIGKWFEMWFEDKQMILETMKKNLVADLQAGYDPSGIIIARQKVAIEDYQRRFDAQVDKFKDMEDAKVNKWCYYDLKKRGAIS